MSNRVFVQGIEELLLKIGQLIYQLTVIIKARDANNFNKQKHYVF